MLQGKRILVGISAGIAAYKSVFLVRLLKKYGAEVKVVLTPSAHDFVTPLSLATLSGHPVLSEFTVSKEGGEWNNHVAHGLWADAMIIAPATANTMSKMVNGAADNFLLACFLSAKCPVLIAPAMDLDMYKHGSTRENLAKLEEFGHYIVPAESGSLASGLSGEGRMAEPETILEHLRSVLFPTTNLRGKSILITAGPTREAIDPVRFITNHSSGKMGYALAKRAVQLGMEVHLVSGHTYLSQPEGLSSFTLINNANDMFEACSAIHPSVDALIMSAAVADFTPVSKSEQKIKKGEGDMSIQLTRTKDILSELSKSKNDKVHVGFAMETQNEIENAKSKLERKHLDFIVLNSLNKKGAGFGVDTNLVTIIDKDNNLQESELKSKDDIALDILLKLDTYFETT